MKATYPYLTEEKVKKLKESDIEEYAKATLGLSCAGALTFGIVGGLIGLMSPLPGLPLLLGGIGAPLATGTTMFLKKRTDITRALKKEELLETANQKLYRVIKTLADDKAGEIEKEMTFKRRKNVNLSKVKQEDLTPQEIIVQLKKNLKELQGVKADLYMVVLQQLENAYNLNNSLIADEESLNNQVLYGELLHISNEIFDLSELTSSEVLVKVLSTMGRLLYYGDSNQTILNLNQISKALTNYSVSINSELSNKYANLYLEAMLISKEKNNSLSVQTISTIPSKHQLVNVIGRFANRIHSLGGEKTVSANLLDYINRTAIYESEVKLVKMIDEIYEKNLVYDLLGKNLQKEEVKVKTLGQKETKID